MALACFGYVCHILQNTFSARAESLVKLTESARTEPRLTRLLADVKAAQAWDF